MANNGRPTENPNLDVTAISRTVSDLSTEDNGRGKKVLDLRYPDMQSAMRFPVKLPISVKSKSGESRTESQNISANGVLFEMDSDMPIGSLVDFTISLPAEIVGAASDVQLDCRGRVVRSSEDSGRRGVGVVIDEYRFERR
jgi:hypothetical protein